MSEPTCMDLRPWAKEHRYRWRFEESYYGEKAEHRGDGRWYVEILCHNGLIYPCGGETLLAYAKAGVVSAVESLPGVKQHQTDGRARVFAFPLECLDEVAAILKPRRKRAHGASPEQLRAMRERRKSLVQGGQTPQGQPQSERDDQRANPTLSSTFN